MNLRELYFDMKTTVEMFYLTGKDTSSDDLIEEIETFKRELGRLIGVES